MRIAKSRVHFIGIGGIGMCGLAELLHNMGANVSGSDLSQNAQTDRLKEMGVSVHVGHSEALVDGSDVVVYSSAVKPDNVEFRRAKALKIPLIARAEALAEIMHLKRGIAVAGTHGKTTTTSLIASIFLQASQDPTIVVGGRLEVIKSTAQLGKGEWLVAEADESDGSFARLSPEIVVITNIDNDHLDHYKSYDALKRAFYDFASSIPFYGSLIVCGDDRGTRQVFADFPKKMSFFGFAEDSDYRLVKSGQAYEVHCQGSLVGSFKPSMPGRHNALNSLAAIVVGMQAGLSFDQCSSGIESFAGVDRRFQYLATVEGVDYYDDYGHHPTEVEAVLQAFRERFPERRLVVLFQPHRYSRTKDCWDQFLPAFDNSDLLFMLDVYPAGESAIEGVNSKTLCEQLSHGHCAYVASKEELVARVKQTVEPGDVVVTLGAGDVWRIASQLYGKA